MKLCLRCIALLVALGLFTACQPPEFEHCIVNDSPDEIAIEYKGEYFEGMNTAYEYPAKASLEDFKSGKPWRTLAKDEYELLGEQTAIKNTAENQAREPKAFRVKLAPNEVLYLFKSSRVINPFGQNDSKFLDISGKNGKIRLEGKQRIEQFKSYALGWFTLKSNPYVIWYE